ncbi:MAG: HDIG domain-containing protein [Thermodesulfobacteriota bacterium]|nr:HDIG domain-containing protein [Thermodesulfobacteriota bacterium]
MLTEFFKPLFSLSQQNQALRWVLLVITALVFAFTFTSTTLVKEDYAYQLGDVARENIKAPEDFLIKDAKATEDKRRQASENILTIYDYKDSLVREIDQRLSRSFGYGREAFQEAASSSASDVSMAGYDREKFEKLLGISVSNGAFTILEREAFSRKIETLIRQIVSEILSNGVVANKEVLLRERGRGGIVLRTVGNGEQKIETNLRHFYGQDQAQAMVRIIGEPLLKDMDYTVKNLIVDFSQRLIVPNVTRNTSKTEQLKREAQESISPVLYKIKKGEMILREGERITQLDLLELESLKSRVTEKNPIAIAIGAAIIGAILFLVIYLRISESKRRGALSDNKTLLFFATMLCLSFIAARLAFVMTEAIVSVSSAPAVTPEAIFMAVPLATSAMIVCLFMDIELTASFALILALCTGAIFENRFEIFVYAILNMTMAAYWMQHCRERKVFIKAGLKLGLFNMVVATSLNLYLADFSILNMAVDCGLAFLGGIAAGILTAGLAPIIEMAFDYTTDIKLLELSNLDQPLLKRLMLEAPGTYHHSLVVGAMVEAAASDVGANPLLARVCGYYHDIGKIKKPLYYIENQKGAKNKHDKLAPSMSALILISHIKDGVEIARKHRLGQPIVDAIQQHHGTRLIVYFYEKAKRQLKEEGGKHATKDINVDDFRYTGPKPQTREAGLVMLADEIEAASRSMESPTPSRIQGLMQDLINKTFSDGQLNDCELTLKDLNNIARNFNNILSGIYHHRIEYPAATNGKPKNGNTDRQPPKPSPSSETDAPDEDTGRLKRLGQS